MQRERFLPRQQSPQCSEDDLSLKSGDGVTFIFDEYEKGGMDIQRDHKSVDIPTTSESAVLSGWSVPPSGISGDSIFLQSPAVSVLPRLFSGDQSQYDMNKNENDEIENDELEVMMQQVLEMRKEIAEINPVRFG